MTCSARPKEQYRMPLAGGTWDLTGAAPGSVLLRR